MADGESGFSLMVSARSRRNSSIMLHKDSFFLARLVNGTLKAERGRDDLFGLSPIFQPVAARHARRAAPRAPADLG